MLQTRRRIQTKPLTDWVSAIGQPILAALCGLLAANAALPFGLLPFGVAAACLYFDHAHIPFILAGGAIVGYLLQGPAGLIYIAGILLALPLRHILTILFRRASRQTVSLLTAAASLTFVHLLTASASGFLPFDLLTGALSVVAGVLYAFFACLCLPAALKSETRISGLTQTESAALLITLCVLLLPLTRFSFFGVTPARMTAAFLVLCFAVYGGAAMGGMGGAIVGTLLSFADPSTNHIIAAYAVGGILAGLIGRKGRLRTVTVFLLGVSVLSLYINGSTAALATLCEASLACGVFALLPEKASAALSRLLTLKAATDAGQSSALCTYLSDRLSATAQSLDRISRTLTPNDQPLGTTDLRAALDQACEATCRRCARSTSCHIAHGFDTEKVFGTLADTLASHPAASGDLPNHFKERCPSWQTLLDTANGLGLTHRATVQNRRESDRNKTVLAAQYASLSQLIGELGEQIEQPLRFDEALTRRLEEYFAAKHCRVRSLLVYRDRHDGLYIKADLGMHAAPSDRRTLSDISALCGANMTVLTCSPDKDGWHLLLGRRETFKLEVAAAQQSKSGERACGDAYTRFRPRAYHQTIVLSDGMGSGDEAHRQAVLTCEILESIMNSGFCTEKSLRLLNSTLLLSTDAQIFSTLDVADFDLFSGRVDLYKLGASDTFVLRGGRSYRIPCASVPVGILGQAEPEHRYFTLKDGDLLLLHSDGIELTDELLLALQSQDNLHDLCHLCLNKGAVGDDDRTVLLIRVKTR